MKTFNLRSNNFVFSVTIMILFASTIWISSIEVNPIHALPNQQQTSSIPNPLGVKITDPIKGQRLAVGKNLTVLGTSNYSATSNCGVSVIVDSIRPYQKTIPIGQAGGNNYSKWKIAPTYAGTIREGPNRITAKLLCQAIPENLTKFYSINVTGVNEIVPNQQHLAIKSNNTAVVPISSNNSSQINHLPVPIASTSSSSASSDSSGHHHHHHSISGKHHYKESSRTHHGYNGGYPYYGGYNGGFFGHPY
ncbi:MAG: hypothetical protein WAM42_04835 [Candidatus Nitrosopolaris sp.]